MHYRLFVLTNKDNAMSSDEARSYVNEYLNNEGFADSDKRFSSGHADWFVIGGRWSGEIEWLKIYAKYGKDKVIEFWKEFEKEEYGWRSNNEKDNKMKELRTDVLFNKYFPDSKPFLNRDTYNQIGYDDDAQIVTEEIWKGLETMWSKKEEGKPQEFDVENGIIDTDTYDGDTIVREDIVNKKWLVVVDYHN